MAGPLPLIWNLLIGEEIVGGGIQSEWDVGGRWVQPASLFEITSTPAVRNKMGGPQSESFLSEPS